MLKNALLASPLGYPRAMPAMATPSAVAIGRGPGAADGGAQHRGGDPRGGCRLVAQAPARAILRGGTGRAAGLFAGPIGRRGGAARGTDGRLRLPATRSQSAAAPRGSVSPGAAHGSAPVRPVEARSRTAEAASVYIDASPVPAEATLAISQPQWYRCRWAHRDGSRSILRADNLLLVDFPRSENGWRGNMESLDERVGLVTGAASGIARQPPASWPRRGRPCSPPMSRSEAQRG
jgi:hypothetical protein